MSSKGRSAMSRNFSPRLPNMLLSAAFTSPPVIAALIASFRPPVIVLLMPGDPDSLTREISAASGKAPEMDLRSYGIGAQILADLGIHDMILLTNAHRNVVGIEGYGINIVGERPIPEA